MLALHRRFGAVFSSLLFSSPFFFSLTLPTSVGSLTSIYMSDRMSENIAFRDHSRKVVLQTFLFDFQVEPKRKNIGRSLEDEIVM